MKFRPCIDIHNGIVKQIVGSTLTENASDTPIENFVATKTSEEYARMYRKDNLKGGHVIMLGPNCEEATMNACTAYPHGLHVGGGITSENAKMYIDAGASHVIVTSYVFQDGQINFDRLKRLVDIVGKDHLVLDLSCRRKKDGIDGKFYVVTNKWTKFTDFSLSEENLWMLSQYCDEFLVHGVDVEGKRCGIEEDLVRLLGQYCPIPVTYAGGIRSIEDMELVKRLGNDKVDCTIGSALDIFGGDLSYRDVVAWHHQQTG